MPKKVWFKISNWQLKIGFVVDGFYDGLLQIQEEETGVIYISAPDEIENFYDRSSFRSHDYECGIY